MKHFSLIIFIVFVCTLCVSSTKSVKYAIAPPEGFTGATGAYCNNCHNEYPVNSVGGSVTLTGLPTGNYIPNATYNLSLKINHSTADRYRWGFSMKSYWCQWRYHWFIYI